MFLYRLLLVAILVLFIYEAYPPLLSNAIVSSAKIIDEKSELYLKALRFWPNHKDALSQLAVIELQNKSYNKAIKLAKKSLSLNPTDGRSMSVLVTSYDAVGNEEEAKKALGFATVLWPSHAYVRIQTADYWTKRGDIEKTLAEWHVLLSRHKGFYKDLFPVLKAYIEMPGYDYIFKPYYQEPASWWGDFFIYLTKQDIDLKIIVNLYRKRVISKLQMSSNERNAYVSRMVQEKKWLLAYSAWMGGISSEERKHISLINNGSFEAAFDKSAFNWKFKNNTNYKISINRIRNAAGKFALKMSFKGRAPIVGAVLRQRLLLKIDQEYKVNYLSKIDRLSNKQGLKWIIRCADKSNKRIASSAPIDSRNGWNEGEFFVNIPKENCGSQFLELVSASKYLHERLLKGVVWLDGISIEPVNRN